MLYVFHRANVVHIAWNAQVKTDTARAVSGVRRVSGPLSLIMGSRSN